MKLSFYGAAQEVTGSCFLLEDESNKILIDCGLFQCPKVCNIRSREPFPFDPKSIDAVFVTHSHVDHIGRIPKLVRDGFRGKILSSRATHDLSKLMLDDSVKIMAREAEHDMEDIFYEEADVEKAMTVWEGIDYHQKIQVGNFSVTLYDSGHLLGSAMIMVEHVAGNSEAKKVLFTGDLGNSNNPLLKEPEEVKGVNVLVIESTYGDREHENVEEKELKLERAIERSVGRGGVLMIPAFSLERTQKILWEISDMLKNKQIPKVPIFLDSPLAIRAIEVYKKYLPNLEFPAVEMTLRAEDSKKINQVPSPKIIVAGSGMSTGGRILHHERRYLSDSKSTILFVGYQASNSLGRHIQDGAKTVTIFDDQIPVKCHIETIHGYSAHIDQEGLFEFVRDKSDSIKKAFVVHGEPKSSLAFVQKVRDYLGVDAIAPRNGDTVEI
jgi:metallo-beta-lactamase family protein